MTFEQKRDAVDLARLSSIKIDELFKELLGSGMSTVGAYNKCYSELEKNQPVTKPTTPVKKPVNTTTKVIKADEQSSKLK